MEARLAPITPEARPALTQVPADEPFEAQHEAAELARIAELPVRQATVDIVLVAYESRGDLESYFHTVLRAAERLDARVIVADNGSTDGSLAYARSCDRKRVVGIDMRGNHGYATAVNAAASVSSADFLILLNPDVEVPQPASLVQLIDHLQTHPSAAVAAPRLLNADGSVQESARCVPTLGMLAGRQTPLRKTEWGKKRAERYLELPNVPEGHAVTEWALGAAMAIRRADFERMGGFDDKFFLYFEDVDFCVRLAERGRQVHYVPDVTLFHDHHRKSDAEKGSALRSRARRAHMRSAVRFFRKHPSFAARRGMLEREATVTDVLRRAFDIAVSATLLTVLAPLLALIAVAIKIESPGPVLFRQRRLGKEASPFTMLKFRSMHADCSSAVHHDFVRRMITGVDVAPTPLEEDGKAIYKVWPDHRVTRVGDLIRRLSLDELPQLWNVLRGDMTLVGFRPPIPYEVEYYPEWYHGRFAVKPGITGLWQVSGRNEKTYEEMVRYDIEYIEQRNWKLDLVLLVKTAGVVLARRGAV